MENINAEKFRIIIAENGYSIRDLAKTTGISETTVNKWLHGAGAQLRTLGKIAKALNIPLADFVKAIS